MFLQRRFCARLSYIATSSILLTSCALPMRVGDKESAARYNMVMETLVCEAIDAWQYERNKKYQESVQEKGYGKRWKVAIRVTQTKTHGGGLSFGWGGKDVSKRWVTVPGASIGPSLNRSHEVVSSVIVFLPDTITQDQINSKGEIVKKGNYYKIANAIKFCKKSEYNLNISPLRIRDFFKSYIDKFNEDQSILNFNTGQLLTNLKYRNTAVFAASIDPKFTFSLQPYTGTIGPSLSYEDKVFIEMDVTRSDKDALAAAFRSAVRNEAKKQIAIEDEIKRLRSETPKIRDVTPPPKDLGEIFMIVPDPAAEDRDERLQRVIEEFLPNQFD